MANMPQRPGAVGVGGHTPHGTVPASPSRQPSQDTNRQVLVVSPAVSYNLEGTLAGRPTRILVDTGSTLTLVHTDHWDPLQRVIHPLDSCPATDRGSRWEPPVCTGHSHHLHLAGWEKVFCHGDCCR